MIGSSFVSFVCGVRIKKGRQSACVPWSSAIVVVIRLPPQKVGRTNCKCDRAAAPTSLCADRTLVVLVFWVAHDFFGGGLSGGLDCLGWDGWHHTRPQE